MSSTAPSSNSSSGEGLCIENLQEFLPGAYAFWLVCMNLFFIAILFALVWVWYENIKKARIERLAKSMNPGSGKRKRRGMMQSMVIRRHLLQAVKPVMLATVLVFVATRLVWLVDPHPRSKPYGVTLFGAAETARPAVTILLTFPQILGLIASAMLVLMWRRITGNALKLQRSQGSKQKEVIIIVSACSYLLFVCAPLAGVTTVITDGILYALYSFAFGIYIILVTSLGVWYIVHLRRLVQEMRSASQRALASVQRVTRTAQLMVTGSVVLILTLIFRNLAIDSCALDTSASANAMYLIFIFGVHTAETIFLAAFVYSLHIPTSQRKGGSGVRGSQTLSSQYSATTAMDSTSCSEATPKFEKMSTIKSVACSEAAESEDTSRPATVEPQLHTSSKYAVPHEAP